MSNLLTGNTMGQANGGTAANQPPNCAFEKRAPTQYDVQYSLLDLWLDMSTTPDGDVWILTSLAGNSSGQLAHWVKLTNDSGSGVLTVTGNSGGAVPPDGSGNLNLVGNTANGLTVAGNPGTNTLTINTTGNVPLAQSLTGDSGGTVNFDSSGNIFINASPSTEHAGATVEFHGIPGSHALILNVTDANNNTMIGEGAGSFAETGTNNTALGTDALTSLTSGSFNSGFGSGTALGMLTTGSQNTAIGYGVLDEITTGSNNTALGAGAGNAYTGAESSNIVIGNFGLIGESNVIRVGTYGSGSGQQDHTYIAVCYSNYGVSNTFVGVSSGNDTLTTGSAQRNASVGEGTLLSLTTGADNAALGSAALTSCQDGSENVAVGEISLTALTSGDENTFAGSASGQYLTTGSNNIGLGWAAFTNGLSMTGLVSGSHNIGIGSSVGSAYTAAESNNILIGNTGTAAENNTLRIGTSGSLAAQQNRCFIAGIRGVTTDVNDAIPVLIDSAGQLGTVSSSIRYKENIKDMGHESEAVFKLRPVTFNNKKDENKVKRFGLIAEEVAEVMPQLVVYDKDGNCETVKYHELPIFLLSELQKQRKTIDALSLTVRHLENQLQTCTCK